jgi:hypothetical protein
MNGLRTNEGGFGNALGARGASDVLLNAAIRSRKDETPSTFGGGVTVS